jgi:hypothetical protein
MESIRFQNTEGFRVALVAFMVVVTLILPQAVLAVCDHNLDTDNDGFTDWEECVGLTTALDPPPSGPAQANIDFPACAGVAASNCLHPARPDLFVYINKLTPTYIPENALQYLESGMGITVHFLNTALPNRIVIDRGSASAVADTWQKHVTIREQPSSTGNILGLAEVDTTPNRGPFLPGSSPADVEAWVYPRRIINFIEDVHGVDELSADLYDNVFIPYYKHVLAHETAHNMDVRPENSRYGFHYRDGYGTIMERSIKYTDRKGKITWYISDTFTDNSALVKKFKGAGF